MRKLNYQLSTYLSTYLGIGLSIWLLALGAAACSGDGIDSDEEARRAYLGLDPSIEKSLALGFDGFNAASSANIDPQEDIGDLTGTLTITGQVDQGASDNKGMRLYVGMVDYADEKVIIEGEEEAINLTYNTSDDPTLQPYLNLSLRNIPDGTFTGTLTGTYYVSGDIEADVYLNLSMSGYIQDDGTGKTIRTPGTTTVTGVADSGDGTYEVNVTI
jgi:hypothetical protein